MRFLTTVALASAVGLGVSQVAAQQDEAAEEPQEAAMEEEVAAEPRSEEETLSDHRRSFLDRAEARRDANSEPVEGPPDTGLRYHPGW